MFDLHREEGGVKGWGVIRRRERRVEIFGGRPSGTAERNGSETSRAWNRANFTVRDQTEETEFSPFSINASCSGCRGCSLLRHERTNSRSSQRCERDRVKLSTSSPLGVTKWPI